VDASAELEALKEVCRLQERFAAGAKLFAVSFQAAPNLAEDMKKGYRFVAACFAVGAAVGKGRDAIKLDEAGRASLRLQALDWLYADLAHWTEQAASDRPADRALVQQKLKHWQREPDLAPIRDKDALAKLPAEERASWEKLWANVAGILKKVGETK
jgi:hypothetical protein